MSDKKVSKINKFIIAKFDTMQDFYSNKDSVPKNALVLIRKNPEPEDAGAKIEVWKVTE